MIINTGLTNVSPGIAATASNHRDSLRIIVVRHSDSRACYDYAHPRIMLPPVPFQRVQHVGSHASPLDPNANFTILEYCVCVRHFSL